MIETFNNFSPIKSQDYSPNVLTWQDYEGRTAIHYAVAVENIEVVEHLLSIEEISAVLDRPDNSFRTPLHWAAQLGSDIYYVNRINKYCRWNCDEVRRLQFIQVIKRCKGPEICL